MLISYTSWNEAAQILINPNGETIRDPWYNLKEINTRLYTPEWNFVKDNLKRFK